MAAGTVIGAITWAAFDQIGYFEAGLVGGVVLSGASALVSIPFFVKGKNKKENAYQVYNEYCAKPTASLSFGPATKGIGMGVYLNF